MQRNNSIDSVKGFAILLVMLGHCIVLNGLNTSDPYIYDFIKSVQMPLFMMVSGVLAAMGLKNKYDYKRLVKKLPRRALSYLLPFFSWFILVYVWTHAVSHKLSVRTFLTELKQLIFQTDKGLWFLMTLFVVLIIVTIAQSLTDWLLYRKLSDQSKNAINSSSKVQVNKQFLRFVVFIVIACMIYALFFLQSRSGNTFLSPSLTVQYFPFYLMGYAGNGYFVDFLKDKEGRILVPGALKWIAWLVCLVLFLAMVVKLDLNQPADSLNKLLMQMSASFLGTVVCYFGVYQTAEWLRTKQKEKDQRGFLAFIGTYTLEIYVLHFRFARLLHLADKNLTLYSMSGFAWLLASFLLMSVLTAVSIWLIKKVKPLAFVLFGR